MTKWKESYLPLKVHALSYVEKLAPKMNKDEILVVTISGRGDRIWKQLDTICKQEVSHMTKLFIPYIMGNKSFIKNMKILDENGALIIEIGVPFSDPVGDGPK